MIKEISTNRVIMTTGNNDRAEEILEKLNSIFTKPKYCKVVVTKDELWYDRND